MGLEVVEIVMEVEETFGIEIPDADAEKLVTPRLLIDYVCRRLDLPSEWGERTCPTLRAFLMMRPHFLRHFGCQRHEFRPSADIDFLVPLHDREQKWSYILPRSGSRYG